MTADARSTSKEVRRRLEYTIAPDLRYCPDEEHFRQQVRLRMPYDPFHTDAQEAVSVSVTRRGTQLVSRIDFLDGSGRAITHRELTAPDTPCACWFLLTDSAVSVAFTITPFSSPKTLEPPTACAEPPPPAPAPRDVTKARTRTPDEHSKAKTTDNTIEKRAGGISLIPLISAGFTPSVAAGGAVDVAMRWKPLSVGLDLRALASETTDTDSAVRTLMGRAHVSACGHRGFFSLCVVLGLGRLYAMKDPTIKIVEAQEPWSGSLGLRPSAEWQFSEHLALRGFAELHAILGHASVWVDGKKLWAAPPVAVIFGVGMMLPFGNRVSYEKTARGDVPRLY